MNDLFDTTGPGRVRVLRNPEAYAGRPGEGPAGKTCGDCRHFMVHQPVRRRYFKCERVWLHEVATRIRASERGPATDIRKNMPACEYFEEEE